MAIKGISASWNGYLFCGPESTWGTAVTPDIYLPYIDYTVVAVPEFYQSDNFTGVRQAKGDNERLRTGLRGGLTMDASAFQINSGSLKSVTQHLMDAALSAPADEDLDSFTFALFDPNEGDGNDSKEHDGMRIDTMVLAGDASTGVIRLTFGFEGAEEAVATQVALPNATQQRPMLFRDSTFQIGGVTTVLNSFSLSLANNILVRHNNSQWPTHLVAGPRVIGYVFGFDRLSATYDVLRRDTSLTDQTAEIVIKGNHSGTAANTNTVATIAIDLMQFGGVSDSLARAEVHGQSTTYVVIKPDTTSNDIDITWSTD